MVKYIKKAVPGCFGASLAVTVVQAFRYPGIWKLENFLVNFLVTFVITAIVVSMCFWLWNRLKSK